MSNPGKALDGNHLGSNGNKCHTQRTSVFAEALKYEAVQGTPQTGDVEKTSSPKSTSDVSPSAHYLEPVQASVFSAFGKDAGKEETEEFENGAGRQINNSSNMDKSPVNDMTKQCSMIHRMMEQDKTDIDPRDVHKLLPSTMLSSESLDLRPDGILGRLSQNGTAGMDLHSLLEDQALKFVAEHECVSESKSEQEDNVNHTSKSGGGSQEISSGVPEVVTPIIPEVETKTAVTTANGHSEAPSKIHAVEPVTSKSSSVRPPSVRSVDNSQQQHQTTAPTSPVTGWPAAPVLGIMHPMNHTICHVPRTSDVVANHPHPRHPLLYTDTNTVSSAVPAAVALTGINRATNVKTTPMIIDWTAAAYPHQTYPGTRENQHGLNYQSVVVSSPISETQNSPPPQESSPRGSRSPESGQSSKDKSEDSSSKSFKSLEAALAWCHVQHSQKQVPVVPKDDVRKLVDFQLNSGKPIRAPWYRPQSDKPDQDQIEKKVVEKRPKIPRPERTRRGTSNGKKQGTGFFCPPGSSMTRA